jgi:hypothetical protein
VAQSGPWRRIISESIAIIASILIAFAIDAAWDSHQERQELSGLLLGLRTEAVANRDRAATSMLETDEAIGRLMRFRSGSSTEWNELDARQFWIEVYLPLIRDWAASFQTGFLDATISSGKLALIPNPDTRAALADLAAAFTAVDRLTLEMDRTGTEAAAAVGEYKRVRWTEAGEVETDRTGMNELREDERLLGIASARIVYFGGYRWNIENDVLPKLDSVISHVDRDLATTGLGSRSNQNSDSLG